MKIVIESLHIEKFITGGLKPVPRGTLGPNPLRTDKQREEISKLRKERDEFQASYARANEQIQALNKAGATSSNTHIEILKGKNERIIELEDKVAGYELGMSKEQVKKECGLTQKGTKRINRVMLTKEQVWQIRRFDKMGRKICWIRRRMNLPENTVGRVVRGEAYNTVPAEPPRKPTKVHAGHGVEE